MYKNEFLENLKNRLSSLPIGEVEKTVEYYRELIEDMVEDGMTEETAVGSLRDINHITDEVLKDYHQNSDHGSTNNDSEYCEAKATFHDGSFRDKAGVFYEEKVKPFGNHETKIGKKRYPTWLIIILSVTAIIWIPLLLGLGIGAIGLIFGLSVGLFALILGLFIALIAVIVSVGFVVPFSGIVVLIATPTAFITLGAIEGFIFLGSSLALIGLGILAIIACCYLFKWTIQLMKTFCKYIMVFSRFLTRKFKSMRGKTK